MKQPIYLVVTLILVAGLFSDLSIGGDAAVTYKELQWQCPYRGDANDCQVSFEIVNHTPAPQVRKVTIRGIRVPPGEKDENARQCDQIKFSILLEPHETLSIRERIPVDAKLDNILVLIKE